MGATEKGRRGDGPGGGPGDAEDVPEVRADLSVLAAEMGEPPVPDVRGGSGERARGSGFPRGKELIHGDSGGEARRGG